MLMEEIALSRVQSLVASLLFSAILGASIG
jgi:hypothetical protein